MERDRYQRIKRLVVEADALPGNRRAAFLAAACGDDAELRAEVERLLRPATLATRDLAVHDGLHDRMQGGPNDTRAARFAPQPGDRIGPYLVAEELGRGGMGIVCAAQDTRDVGDAGEPREVALKLIYPHLHGLRERFAREARLGRKVDHENVVRAIETIVWDHDGVTHDVLVMERVRGRNLREALAEWRRMPEALVREIARQVAAGLTAIHAAGVVHRDLKPENVLLTDDRRVRIMDLGIAKVQETAFELTLEGQFVGSLAYAAPEQLASSEIGAACDLYSLGVVLYELVTGENPFRRDDIGALVAAHLGERPPALRDRAGDVSPFLSDVVETLLARSPSARFPSAQVLLELLEEAEESAWWREREQSRPRSRGGCPDLPVEHATPLHGRTAELGTLQACWDSVQGGTGRLVLIEGEAGIGKTRLLDAFVRDVVGNEARILYGAFPASGGLRGLTDAIEGALGSGAVAECIEPLLGGVSVVDEERAALLRREPSALDALPIGEGAVTALCCRVLRRLAAEGKPVVWILDDVQHAPAAARAAALAMARAAETLPVLVVIATRETPPLNELAQMQRLPGFSRLELPRLSAKEVIDLLEDALGSETLADRLGARIARKSDGVPFFVFEMLRALSDDGTLARDDSGSCFLTRSITDIDVPSAIRDLVVARIAELSRGERETLDVAAVMGVEFDATTIARVLGRPLVQTLQDLAELERHRKLVRSVGRGHRFDHHQFCEVIYRELPGPLREEYHALVAEALTPSTAEADGRAAVALARHHLRGSRPALGLPHLTAALEHVESCHRHEDAADLAELAISHETLVDTRQRVRLHLRAYRAHDSLGRRDPQLDHAQEAARLADGIGDARLRALAQSALGGHAYMTHDNGEAIARLRAALALAAEADDEGLQVDVMVKLANAHSQTRDFEPAYALLDDARARADALGDPARRGETMRVTAGVLAQQLRYEEALKLIEPARALLEEAGDWRSAASAHSLWGSLSWYLGRVSDARLGFQRCLELGRRVGDRRLEVNARGRLGLASLHAGRLDEALRQFRHHRDGGIEIGDTPAVGQALANLSQTECLLGRFEEGVDCAMRAAQVGRVIDAPRLQAFALTQAAAALRSLGRLSEAAARTASAVELSRNAGDLTLEAQALMEEANIAGVNRDKARAVEILRGVEQLAEAADVQRLTDAASMALARLGAADARAAWERFAREEPHLAVHQRLQAHHDMWEATGDRAHLAIAHELLAHLRTHAPPERRDAMVDDVIAYRDIVDAFTSAG